MKILINIKGVFFWTSIKILKLIWSIPVMKLNEL